MLYALGIGFGSDPVDSSDLRFVYEPGLETFPTMAVCLGYPGAWMADPRSGITRQKLLHAAQSLVIDRPLPAAGEVIARNRVESVVDRGADRGGMIYVRRDLHDAVTGDLVSSQVTSLLCRADGGFGGDGKPVGPQLPAAPERRPDGVREQPTLPQQALLYRLNGDQNPLHADPAVARGAGFERPILHGLCTFGIAARAVAGWFDAVDGHRRLREFHARFTATVYPGETLVFQAWRDGRSRVLFRGLVKESGRVILDNGLADFA